MKLEVSAVLQCPACGGTLAPIGHDPAEAVNGTLLCGGCDHRWPVEDGIPDLVFPRELEEGDAASRSLWDRVGRFYGLISSLTNFMRGVSGSSERGDLIDRLGLRPKSAALEIAAGTGENLLAMTDQIGSEGCVFGVDLSWRMIRQAKRKLSKAGRPVNLVLGNAARLPFRNGTFDAVLDGFGMKYYPNKNQAIREMLRVVKPGGKVVIKDLGLPESESLGIRQRLLRAWIPHFDEPPPLREIPDDVRDLSVSWYAHNTAYAVEFRKPDA